MSRSEGMLYGCISVVATAVVLAKSLMSIVIGALLVLFEPIVRIVLCTAALAGFCVTLLFGFVAGAPGFPAWGMLGMSVALLCVYWGYLALLGWVIGGYLGRAH